MSLKSRIERLEVQVGRQQEEYEIDLGNGIKVRLPRVQIAELLQEINGAGTGPGPSRSRRSSSDSS